MSTMPPRLDERARELFAQAVEHPESEWAALLASECRADPGLRQEVEALLAAHLAAQDQLLESSQPVGEQAGDRIGNYKLLQRIGEGGFGTVWMAEPSRRMASPRRRLS